MFKDSTVVINLVFNKRILDHFSVIMFLFRLFLQILEILSLRLDIESTPTYKRDASPKQLMGRINILKVSLKGNFTDIWP